MTLAGYVAHVLRMRHSFLSEQPGGINPLGDFRKTYMGEIAHEDAD
jgi:hypothetical protein